MEGGRKDFSHDSSCEVRILEGFLWSLCCLHLQGKWEKDLLKVTELLSANRWETQMSTPGPALEPCLVEGYLVGGENGKIVFWKACLSL